MSRHEIENLYSLAVGVEIGDNGDSLLRFKIAACKFYLYIVNQVFV
jgi:hypothetical protein